jgi:hypothetical protein
MAPICENVKWLLKSQRIYSTLSDVYREVECRGMRLELSVCGLVAVC